MLHASNSVLVGFACLALAASGARAEPATAPSVVVTTIPNAASGFDQPAQALKLDMTDAAALDRPSPGQDLRGTAPLQTVRLSAADLDSYENSNDYKQLLAHYAPKKPLRAGKQLGGLGAAAATALVRLGIKMVKDRVADEVDERIDEGVFPPALALGVRALGDAADVATALKPAMK